MSRYLSSDSYLIAGTTVLSNKAGITDQALLDAFEADITAVRMLELTESPIQGQFDLAHLQKIHHHVFQDIYDWAGQIRTVDISRGQSRFANVNQIVPYAHKVFDQLTAEQNFRSLRGEALATRLAHYAAEINAMHPFRDGNGRVQRIFVAQMAEEAGYFLDYSTLTKDEIYKVMEASFFGNEKPLALLLVRLLVTI